MSKTTPGELADGMVLSTLLDKEADRCDRMNQIPRAAVFRDSATELRRLDEEIKEWNVAYGVWNGTLALRATRIAELEKQLEDALHDLADPVEPTPEGYFDDP